MNRHREIKSRRNRPAKPPLSREAIVDKALEILTRDGLASLTLRKVAAALDTGAASLYVYIDNLEDLKSQVLDRALAEVEIPGKAKGDWRVRLKALVWSYMRVLTARPGLGLLAISSFSTGVNTLRLMESILGLLLEGGLDDLTAAWALDAVLVHTSAVSAEQDARREARLSWARMRQAIENFDGQAYPNISRLGRTLLDDEKDARSHWGFEFLLNGILSTPLTSEPK
jgi:AcrR family transcriptional regulator